MFSEQPVRYLDFAVVLGIDRCSLKGSVCQLKIHNLIVVVKACSSFNQLSYVVGKGCYVRLKVVCCFHFVSYLSLQEPSVSD